MNDLRSKGNEQPIAKVITEMGMEIFGWCFHLIVTLFFNLVMCCHLMNKLIFCNHFWAINPSQAEAAS